MRKFSVARVHWLLFALPAEFKGEYILSYDYVNKNYIFYRLQGRRLLDGFVITKQSRHYYRGMYFNCKDNRVEYFGHYKVDIIAEIMVCLWYESKEVLV